jgi:hypothetical protein
VIYRQPLCPYVRHTQYKMGLCGIVREELAKIYFLIYLFLFLSLQFSENCTYVILQEYYTNKRNARAMFVNVFWKVFFIYSLKKKNYEVTKIKIILVLLRMFLCLDCLLYFYFEK